MCKDKKIISNDKDKIDNMPASLDIEDVNLDNDLEEERPGIGYEIFGLPSNISNS